MRLIRFIGWFILLAPLYAGVFGAVTYLIAFEGMHLPHVTALGYGAIIGLIGGAAGGLRWALKYSARHA